MLIREDFEIINNSGFRAEDLNLVKINRNVEVLSCVIK